MTSQTETYPGAPEELIALWQKRRRPMEFHGAEAIAPLDVDLVELALRTVPVPAEPPIDASSHARKEYDLRKELAGNNELTLLNSLLIAHLRRHRFPAHAPALFHRIWREQGGYLIKHLSTRWLISSAITFGDHGEDADQRCLGYELSMLFSMIKLYEFERLFSGCAPNEGFGLRRSKASLPLELPGFSLKSGGLDVNLLAPIWRRAQDVPVLGPLACELLDRLNRDPGTLFRRLSIMKAARQKKMAKSVDKG